MKKIISLSLPNHRTISTLPSEIKEILFSYLEPHEVVQLHLTKKHFSNIDELSRELQLRYFPDFSYPLTLPMARYSALAQLPESTTRKISHYFLRTHQTQNLEELDRPSSQPPYNKSTQVLNDHSSFQLNYFFPKLWYVAANNTATQLQLDLGYRQATAICFNQFLGVLFVGASHFGKRVPVGNRGILMSLCP